MRSKFPQKVVNSAWIDSYSIMIRSNKFLLAVMSGTILNAGDTIMSQNRYRTIDCIKFSLLGVDIRESNNWTIQNAF